MGPSIHCKVNSKQITFSPEKYLLTNNNTFVYKRKRPFNTCFVFKSPGEFHKTGCTMNTELIMDSFSRVAKGFLHSIAQDLFRSCPKFASKQAQEKRAHQ